MKLTLGAKQVFTKDIEDSIASYCVEVSRMGYGLSVDKVRELAFEVADKNEVKMPAKWTTEKKAGLDWFKG